MKFLGECAISGRELIEVWAIKLCVNIFNFVQEELSKFIPWLLSILGSWFFSWLSISILTFLYNALILFIFGSESFAFMCSFLLSWSGSCMPYWSFGIFLCFSWVLFPSHFSLLLFSWILVGELHGQTMDLFLFCGYFVNFRCMDFKGRFNCLHISIL